MEDKKTKVAPVRVDEAKTVTTKVKPAKPAARPIPATPAKTGEAPKKATPTAEKPAVQGKKVKAAIKPSFPKPVKVEKPTAKGNK